MLTEVPSGLRLEGGLGEALARGDENAFPSPAVMGEPPTSRIGVCGTYIRISFQPTRKIRSELRECEAGQRKQPVSLVPNDLACRPFSHTLNRSYGLAGATMNNSTAPCGGGSGVGLGMVPVRTTFCDTTVSGVSVTAVAEMFIPFLRPQASVSWPLTLNFWPSGM